MKNLIVMICLGCSLLLIHFDLDAAPPQQSGPEEVFTVSHETEFQISDLIVMEDHKRMITYSGKGYINIWDLENGVLLQSLETERDLLGIQLNSDQTRLLTYGRSAVAQIWDISTGQELHHMYFTFRLFGADWFQDEQHVIAWGTGYIVIWNLVDNTLQIVEECDPENPTENKPIGRLMWDDQSLFASSLIFDVNKIWVWDIETGNQTMTLLLDSDPVGLAFSPDQTMLMAWTWTHAIWIWDVETGELVNNFGHRLGVNGAAWHEPTGYLLSWAIPTARVWDVNGNNPMVEFDFGNSIDGSIISPDGKRVVSYSFEGRIVIWDIYTGETLQTLEEATYFQGLAWYNDDYLYTTFFPDRVVIWNANTGMVEHTIEQQGDIIGSNWFEDNLILTWARTGQITLWRLPD